MAVEGAGETDPSRAETQGVVGVPTVGAQEPSPQLYPCRLWWAAPLGQACTPPGRCQGLHNSAPGMGARPAHSARNNHSSAAAGRQPPGAGGQEGSRWASGVRFPAWGRRGCGGQSRVGGGEDGSSPSSSGPSQSLVPERGWDGCGWEGLGGRGEPLCPSPLPPRAGQGGGNTGPRPGLG